MKWLKQRLIFYRRTIVRTCLCTSQIGAEHRTTRANVVLAAERELRQHDFRSEHLQQHDDEQMTQKMARVGWFSKNKLKCFKKAISTESSGGARKLFRKLLRRPCRNEEIRILRCKDSFIKNEFSVMLFEQQASEARDLASWVENAFQSDWCQEEERG